MSFDAELYLRLIGERDLLTSAHGFASPLADVAAALRAVDALPEAISASVLAEYAEAAGLRGDEHALFRHHHFQRPVDPAPPPPLTRVAVSSGPVTTDTHELTVHAVCFTEQQTRLLLTTSTRTAARRRGRSAGGMPAGWLHAIQVTDPSGRSVQAHFNASGNDESQHGWATIEPALDPGCAWLELDGARAELRDPEPRPVHVEPVPDEDPVLGFVWRRLVTANHFDHDNRWLEGTLAAIVAAGAIAGDDPRLGHVRAVADRIPEHLGHFHHHGAPSRPKAKLPEPWGSLLTPRPGPAHEQRIPLGVCTPLLDATRVIFDELELHGGGFSTSVAVEGPHAVELAWWARDDAGRHHLGGFGEYSGGDNEATGRLTFWPAPHPKAAWLELLPTGPTQRAVVRVEL